MTDDDVVRAGALVAVAPDEAFRVFTEEVDAWWRRGPRFRFDPARDGVLRFEGGQGGRLVEVHDEDAGDAYEVGRILEWKPPGRLLFEFRARAFGPDEKTWVEVTFDPDPRGTRVSIAHSGFGAFRDDHPVRHGLVGPAFAAMMGTFWGDLLLAARRHAEGAA